MSNLRNLHAELKEQQKREQSYAEDFFTDANELSEEESSIIEEYKKEGIVMIEDRDESGRVMQTPLEDYTKNLDQRVVQFPNQTEESISEKIKTVNNSDIVETGKELLNEFGQRKMEALQGIIQVDIDPADAERINNDALEAVKTYCGVDRVTNALIQKRFGKKPLDEIKQILPKEFIDLYIPDNSKDNGLVRKERVIAALEYLTTSGPELDYLNDYIDEENKLMTISKRLVQCRIDFSEMLTDEKVLSEFVKESYQIAPKDESYWSQYIKVPNKVSNDFAQRVVVYQHYQTAYEELLNEYPDEPGNEVAREAIIKEIEECKIKQEVYRSACDMELVSPIWDRLITRYTSQKKFSMKYLIHEATEAVTRIRRSKQDVPFPGYVEGTKRPDKILENYLKGFTVMVNNFNTNIAKVGQDEYNTRPKYNIKEIKIEGTEDAAVHMIFGIMVLLIMGRIMKHYMVPTMTKYDAISLDSYFRIFCQMGTDIYILTYFWNLTKDYVEYVYRNCYAPSKK